MGDTNSISLNGQKYDALTGKQIKDSDGDQKKTHHSSSHSQSHRQNGHNQVVDGFFRVGGNRKPGLSTNKNSTGHQIAPHINRVTEHSKTLVRSAVYKPNVTKLKEQPKVAKRKLDYAVARGMAASAPAKEGLAERAKAIKQSEFIGKFNELTTPANPITPDPNTIQTTANSEVHLKNLDHLAQVEANPTADDIFTEAALKLSDSPTTTRKRVYRDHFYEKLADKLHISVKSLLVIVITLIIILAGLVTAYIFSSEVSMYVADNRTGINGTLPTYKPAGFSLKSIGYTKAGAGSSIVIQYHSNSDNRTYSLQEQTTSWDNNALLTSVVHPFAGTNFTTNQIQGRTIYTYHSTTAWVSSGIYYNITNNAGLMPIRLVK